MRYKQIIGGSQEEAEKKFLWLKEARFKNAVIDITGDILIWKNGIWKNGVWKDGIWKNGVWENGNWEDEVWVDGIWKYGVWKGGLWEDGYWEDGVWKNGYMWNNLLRTYHKVVYNKEKMIFEMRE